MLPLPSLKTGSATLNLGKKKTRHSEMLFIPKADPVDLGQLTVSLGSVIYLQKRNDNGT